MKILVADKLAAHVLEQLTHEYDVVFDAALKDEALESALKQEQPNVLVVRSTKVTEKVLCASSNLELVIRAGAGVNTIDVDSASRLGVFVANCPGKNSTAVAELVMGLILAIDRNIPDNVQALREGRWNKKTFGKTKGLKGQRLGLIGYGNIAREVASRAKAFEMEVSAWSRSLTKKRAEEENLIFASSADEIAKTCDIISVHLALNSETKSFCGKEFFSSMKEGAVFVNSSRGEIVDEHALLEALRTKNIRAGLDVFPDEPASAEGSWDSVLGKHPRVYGTHHIGASTAQAESATGEEVRRIVEVYAAKGLVENCVNRDTKSAAVCVLAIRHLNEVGVLAGVLDRIKAADLNILEMSNLIFEGHKAAVANIHVSKEPSAQLVSELQAIGPTILSVQKRKVQSR